MIVWILEPPTDLANSRALQLLGSLTVRAFASLESLITVTRIETAAAPDVVLVNLPASDIAALAERISMTFSEARLVILRKGTCELPNVTCVSTDVSQSDLLRVIRDPGTAHEELVFNDFELDAQRSKLTCLSIGATIELTQKERRLVQLLMARADKEVAREELLTIVWEDVKIAPRTLDSHISRLRTKLAELGMHVSCSYRGGYKLSLTGATALEA